MVACKLKSDLTYESVHIYANF